MPPPPLTAALPQLLQPNAIAVVGASQRGGRANGVIENLRNCGYGGEIFAVNPRYSDVLGCPCVPSVRDLPPAVECIVIGAPVVAFRTTSLTTGCRTMNWNG